MAFDAFLKIDGVEGESTDDKHKGEIDVLSFSWGATQAGLALGQAVNRSGKLQVQDLSFVKRVDKATPKLMLSAAAGSHFPTAILTARKAGQSQQEFLKITMSDILVTSVSAGGNGQTDQLPMEQISFNFSKIEVDVYSDPIIL